MNLGPAALADIPATVEVPGGAPVPADRAYDSDPPREQLSREGFRPSARHRENRPKPPVNDDRRLRRLGRRWVAERTFAWPKSFRRVATRYEAKCHLYDGFVTLACAFIAVGRL